MSAQSPNRKLLLRPGQTFERYTIERLLGHGGMGEVYLARHNTLQVHHALKLLFPDVADNSTTHVERFLREAQLASRIKHPNIIEVHDAGYSEISGLDGQLVGVYYIFMDYLSGGSLGDRLKQVGPLAPAATLEILRQVASALVAAQANNMVHRDIKPDNIMFTDKGLVKLADLGIAKSTGARDETLTMAASVFGTPAYMSPEQARDARRVDCRTDIYSLGCVAFEMLTGRRPYTSTNPMEILSQVVSPQELPNVRTLAPNVPAAVAKLVAAMCAKRLEKRIQTPADLLQRIETLQTRIQTTDSNSKPTSWLRRLTLRGKSSMAPAATDKVPDMDIPRATSRPQSPSPMMVAMDMPRATSRPQSVPPMIPPMGMSRPTSRPPSQSPIPPIMGTPQPAMSPQSALPMETPQAAQDQQFVATGLTLETPMPALPEQYSSTGLTRVAPLPPNYPQPEPTIARDESLTAAYGDSDAPLAEKQGGIRLLPWLFVVLLLGGLAWAILTRGKSDEQLMRSLQDRDTHIETLEKQLEWIRSGDSAYEVLAQEFEKYRENEKQRLAEAEDRLRKTHQKELETLGMQLSNSIPDESEPDMESQLAEAEARGRESRQNEIDDLKKQIGEKENDMEGLRSDYEQRLATAKGEIDDLKKKNATLAERTRDESTTYASLLEKLQDEANQPPRELAEHCKKVMDEAAVEEERTMHLEFYRLLAKARLQQDPSFLKKFERALIELKAMPE